MSRRLLYLDVLRGFFVLYVVWLHALNAIVFGNNADAVNQVNPWLFVFLAPLAIVATWAPIFVMVSGTANAYSMHNAMKAPAASGNARPALRRVLLGAFANNFIIYLMSVMNVTLFHHSMEFNGHFRHTLITSSLQQGALQPFSAQMLFYNDALATIALSGMVVSLTLYVLWRNGGYHELRRNFTLLTGLALTVLFIAPVLHNSLDDTFYAALDHRQWVKAFALKLVIGPNQSPFPNIAFGLFGAIMGIAISEGVHLRKIRSYGYGMAAALVGLAAILIARQGVRVIELTYHTFPIKLHLLNLGLMMGLTTFLIDRMEYSPDARRAVLARRTALLRRVGMVALTVFLLEGAVSVVISKAYMWALGSGGVFPRNVFAVVVFLAILLTFWNVTLALWERFNFKFGFEWVIIQIVGKIRGRKSIRLNAGAVLHGSEITVSAE
jgi:hypothetical protein